MVDLEELDRQAAMEAVSAEVVGQVAAEPAATEPAQTELARVELEVASAAERVDLEALRVPAVAIPRADLVLAALRQAPELAARADMVAADTVDPATRLMVVAALHQELQGQAEMG